MLFLLMLLLCAANSTVNQGPVCHARELTIICGRAGKGQSQLEKVLLNGTYDYV